MVVRVTRRNLVLDLMKEILILIETNFEQIFFTFSTLFDAFLASFCPWTGSATNPLHLAATNGGIAPAALLYS